MQEKLNKTQQPSLSIVPKLIWKYKIFVSIFSILWSTLILVYLLNQSDIYTAEGLYTPKSADQGGAISQLANQFGGLASMAGLNIGGSSQDKTQLAIELMKSRTFLQAFINKHDLLIPLMAAKGWDKINDKLIIDKDIYDQEKKKWIRTVKEGKDPKPTAWEAYSELIDNISIEYISKKHIIKVNISHYSPQIAAAWLQLLIKELNFFWKEKNLSETKNAIELLEKEASRASIAEVREALYGLIAEHIKTQTLTQVTEEVIFETVGEVTVPEEKSKPKRALLLLFFTIIGFFIASICAVIYGLNRT